MRKKTVRKPREKKLFVAAKFCVIGHTFGSFRDQEINRKWLKTVDEAVDHAEHILADKAHDKSFLFVVQIVRVVKRKPATFSAQVIK